MAFNQKEVGDSWFFTEVCAECVKNDPKALDPAYSCQDCGKNVCAHHFLTQSHVCGNFIPKHYGVVPKIEYKANLLYGKRPNPPGKVHETGYVPMRSTSPGSM